MNNKLNFLYTWKDEYALPFETQWSRIAKFCFLNGLPWSYVKKNTSLKNIICADSMTNMRYINLPSFMINDDMDDTFKICPQCMKYGYQSYLHLVDDMDYCFLHKCLLVNLRPEDLYESKDGTYKFFKIKTENIIRNYALRDSLQAFIDKREADGILDISYIFPKYIADAKVCYKSTKQIFQKFYLVQDQVELCGCKCIKSIPLTDIDMENMELAREFLKSYTVHSLQNGALVPFGTSFEEEYEYFQKIYMKQNSDIPYRLFGENLGWSVTKIMLDTIDNLFTGYKDWEENILSVNGYPPNSMKKDNIDKYAAILAYQAITSTVVAKNAFCTNSNYWFRDSYPCKFGLNVYEELGHYKDPYNFFITYKKRSASQYIVFPIIKNLFETLAMQAYEMLAYEKIKLDHEYINHLSTDIWSVPQYVILYYKEKIEIYVCEPD